MRNPHQQLDALLSETPACARSREQSAFVEVSGGRRQIVIFGAGRLGRKIVENCSEIGLEPVAFADNNPRFWGTVASGLPVYSPQEAAKLYSKDATFVVAIWHPSRIPLMAALLAQLRSLGCRAAGFPLLFWSRPAKFLPYFFWDLPSKLVEQSADIAAAFDLLREDASKQSFAAQIQLRLHADFDYLGAPVPDEQYFPGLFTLATDECFVDCGSYTGDTIHTFISQSGSAFRKVIAFEADPAVLPVLQKSISDFGSRVVLHQAAVGSHSGTVRFAGDGIGGGRVNETGLEVPCVRLDDVLDREHTTFIKMDIEGAEIHALEGARHLISRDRPVLAVCGYHTPDHLWRVPYFLKQLAADSELFLRQHCADGLDAVYYAVPPERRIQSTRIPISQPSNGPSLRTRAKGSTS